MFVGPMEHHSNILVWREFGDVVDVPALPSGCVDLAALEQLLIQYKTRFGFLSSNLTPHNLHSLVSLHAPLCVMYMCSLFLFPSNCFRSSLTGRAVRIGSFTAASNVTGILENVDAVTRLLHTHGALAWYHPPFVEPLLLCASGHWMQHGAPCGHTVFQQLPLSDHQLGLCHRGPARCRQHVASCPQRGLGAAGERCRLSQVYGKRCYHFLAQLVAVLSPSWLFALYCSQPSWVRCWDDFNPLLILCQPA